MVFARYRGLCLLRGYIAGECKSALRCKQCQQPHHTSHKSVEDHVDTGTGDGGDQVVKKPATVKAVSTAAGDEMPSHTYSTTSKAKIKLQVVPIEIRKEGRSVSTYALLDTGSRSTAEKRGIQIEELCSSIKIDTI